MALGLLKLMLALTSFLREIMSMLVQLLLSSVNTAGEMGWNSAARLLPGLLDADLEFESVLQELMNNNSPARISKFFIGLIKSIIQTQRYKITDHFDFLIINCISVKRGKG